jgi:hypothetical protein
MARLVLFSSLRRMPLKRVGFTLIEAVLASGLALFLMAGIAELCVHSMRSRQRAESVSAAAGALGARLENIKALPYEAEELSPGEHLETILSPGGKEDFLFEYSVEEAAPGLKGLDMTLTPHGRPAQVIHFKLYISRELESRQ